MQEDVHTKEDERISGQHAIDTLLTFGLTACVRFEQVHAVRREPHGPFELYICQEAELVHLSLASFRQKVCEALAWRERLTRRLAVM